MNRKQGQLATSMKYKTFNKKKIFNGMAELRSIEIDSLPEGYGAKIVIDSEFMLLTPSELKRGIDNGTQHSIYNKGQDYKLLGFRWKPTGRIEEQFTIPFDTRAKLSELWKAKMKGKI